MRVLTKLEVEPEDGTERTKPAGIDSLDRLETKPDAHDWEQKAP